MPRPASRLAPAMEAPLSTNHDPAKEDLARRSAVARIVGFVAIVELPSGILQGYYTPLMTDAVRHPGIHGADVNWFEAVLLLASLGNIFGHNKMLLKSAVVTALASGEVVFPGSFATFLIAWPLQGSYAVWLPLEIAISFPWPVNRATTDP
jgi:hypothetical protein